MSGPRMDGTAEVLRAATLDLTRILDLDRLLEALLDRLRLLVPYDTANVMLLEGSAAVVRAIRGYEKWGDPSAVRASAFEVSKHPVLGALIATHGSILIPDTRDHSAWIGHEGALHVRNWIGVPLEAAGTVIGMYCLDKAQPRFFTDEHVRLTEALAPHAAVAIRNVRLFADLQRSEERSRAQVAELRTLLDVIPIGIGIARDRDCRRIESNRCLSRIFGVPSGANTSLSALPGEAPRDITFRHEGRILAPEELPMQRAAAEGREVVDLEMDLVRDGRTVATILGYAAPLFDEAGRPRGAIGAALEITERKRAEERVRELAYHDPLTGLPNRRLFGDRLSLAVAQAHRHVQRLAVLFLDLDRFKVINDSLGHSAGDRVIHAVSARLRGCLREGDTVARLGGDEFVLLLPDVAQGVDAAKVAEKVLEALRLPFSVEGREIFVTASVGVAIYPEDGEDAEALVKNADTAMYRAKERGRDRYQLYAPAMNATALERLSLESDLRRALAHGELLLHYQPVLELTSGRVRSFEALLRWHHPGRGLVPPDEFIPLAEVTGLLLPVAPWALRRACGQAQSWRRAGHPDVGVSVNLSARQFQQRDLPEQVRRALDETGLPAERLELEITESSAMGSAEEAVETLPELKALGVRLSIDDFGTGYSSLGHLRRLPIDTLKIDQAFVRDVPGDADDAAIVATVIAMSHVLKLEVVAEGVETEEQLRFLGERGCDAAQGYVFSPPVIPELCLEVLAGLARR